jgi:hypothetical protein
MRLYADASWIEVAQVDSSGHQAKTWQPLPAEGDCIPITADDPHGPCLASDDYYSYYYRLTDGTQYRFSYDETHDKGQIQVFDAHGNLLSDGSTDVWNSMTMGADGTAVAWRRVIAGQGENAKITQTKLAVIGKNGRPVAGWPLTFQGAVSEPTIGTDGTIYVSLAAYGTRSARVLAIGLNGKALAGWPYLLPAGRSPRLDGSGAPGDPFYPVAPILGRNGSVYVVADEGSINQYGSFQIKTESIFSIDRNGQLRPGWPAALPGPMFMMQIDPCFDWCGPYFEKPLLATTASGSTLLYVYSGGRLLAIDDTGGFAPGWSKQIGSHSLEVPFSDWNWWAVTPDGGLAAEEVLKADDGTSVARLWRWAPDGTVAH